ncbi:aldehyde dehydrogenase family protein, partial [Ensifer sp. P24N7]|uniref:aldehyde dehydrogenase family protein n=1 Tax=Sinorhizobium sp. P24N7 TaxID=3348358 RepID=UPI0035F3273B
MDIKRNFIANDWVEGASTVRNINPSDTNDVVGLYASADAATTNDAIEAAAAAAPAWARSTPEQRADALDQIGTALLARREELGALLSREEGKILAEGIGEVVRAGRV